MQTRDGVEREKHVHISCLDAVLAVESRWPGIRSAGGAIGGQLSVFVGVGLAEGNMWMRELDVAV